METSRIRLERVLIFSKLKRYSIHKKNKLWKIGNKMEEEKEEEEEKKKNWGPRKKWERE